MELRKDLVVKTILGALLLISVFALFILLNYLNTTQKYEKEIQKIKEEIEKQKQRIDRIYQGKIEVIATAYTSSKEECDSDPYISASGQRVFWGMIATDKKFRFGTKFYIPFFQKTFIALDRGGKIKGNRIDIWMPTKTEAMKFGIKKLVCYILDD